MFEEVKMNWIFVQKVVTECGAWFEEYVSEDEKYGRIVYDDGSEEIYEVAN